jgi:hypothetical protein
MVGPAINNFNFLCPAMQNNEKGFFWDKILDYAKTTHQRTMAIQMGRAEV